MVAVAHTLIVALLAALALALLAHPVVAAFHRVDTALTTATNGGQG